MRNKGFFRVLIMPVLLMAGLFLVLPSLTLAAEGTVTAITGSTLARIGEEDWHAIKEGDAITAGTVVWIGSSSTLTIKVGDRLIEMSGGPVGSNIVINTIEPFDAAIKGTGIRYLNAPKPPPAPPQLLSPLDGTRAVGSSIELSWSPSQKEAIYHIQVSDAPEFKKLVLDEKAYVSETRKIEKLVKGKFYWRVSAADKEGLEGGFSETRSFEIRPVPEPPAVASPASTKTSTTVRWKRANDLEKYHLQISRDKEFSEISVDLRNLEGPRVTVGTLEEGNYFVRVSAADEEGVEGRFSEPQPFYVGPQVPSSNIAPIMIMLSVAFMLLGGH